MIPMDAAELTPTWLNDALGETLGPETRVQDAEVVDWNAGTTGRARLQLKYSGGGSAPATMFVKLPPTDPMQQAMVSATGMGKREVRFYRQLAGEVPVRCPTPYYAEASDDGSAYLMLMEDLAAAGCGFPTSLDQGDAARVRRVAESLARLHAAYWDSPRFDADLAWIGAPMRHELGPMLIKQALDDFGDDMPEVFRGLAALYIERTDEVCDLWEEGERTLCHGDCHIGNQFDDRETPGFLDWAVLCRAPGIRDIAYFLANSIPAEMRRAEQDDVLRVYRQTLAAQGVEPPPAEDLRRRYCRLVGYSWVAATTTLTMGDKWQALSVGKAATARANQALADLSTVDILREDLGP